MTFQFAPSFDRSFTRLPPDRRRRVRQGVDRLIDLFDQGQLPSGFGFKRLRGNMWEFRVGLSDRVIFILEGSVVTFVMVGDHEDVRRYLKHR